MIWVMAAVFITKVVGMCQDCGLKLEPQPSAVHVVLGNNFTILCDASCYGPLTPNQIAWFDRDHDRILRTDRIQSVSYNRWMYIRLIIVNAGLHHTGKYTCTGIVNNSVVRREVNIKVIEKNAQDRPEIRHDVRLPDMRLRRPRLQSERGGGLRHVGFLRNIREAIALSETGSGDGESPISPTTRSIEVSGSKRHQTSAINFAPVPITTREPTAAAGNTQEPSGNDSNGSVDEQSPVSPTETGSGDGETPVSPRTMSSEFSSSKKHLTTVINSETVPTTTRQPAAGNTQEPSGNDSRRHTSTPPPSRPTTAFGKYGVLAFGLASSVVAVLLLCTLLLVSKCIKKCPKKKHQSVNIRTENHTRHKDGKPDNVDFIALKPLQDEQPDDQGFTTIDLDDNEEAAANNNIAVHEHQAGATSSAPSEPPSQPTLVSTFLVGRKPSKDGNDILVVHAGRQADTPIDLTENIPSGNSTTPAGKTAELPQYNPSGHGKIPEDKSDELPQYNPSENGKIQEDKTCELPQYNPSGHDMDKGHQTNEAKESDTSMPYSEDGKANQAYLETHFDVDNTDAVKAEVTSKES